MGVVVEPMPALGVTRVSRWIFNCYVLHDGGGGPVVVDAGLPRTVEDVAPVLGGLHGTLHSVVATHGHSDHVAGIAPLAARFAAPVYLPAPTLTYLDGARPRSPRLSKLARIAPVFADQPLDRVGVCGLVHGASLAGFGTPRGMRWRGPAPAGGLEDGQPLPGAPTWIVLHTPGHTDDSMVLWNESTRTLVSGDTVITARDRAWLTPEFIDVAAMRESARRLLRLPVEHLLPGHGRTVHADCVWDRVRQ